jgi:flagellar biosynthesis protein FlhF
MPYFTEQARTYSECLEKIKAKYGKDFKVLIERTVRKGGLLGLGSHEEVEMTGTYGFSPSVPSDLETAKRQVLAAAGKAAPSADMQAVLKEIASLSGAVRSLNEKVDGSMSPSAPAARALAPEIVNHPSLQKLEEDLYLNEFTPSFTKAILERVRREFPLDELDDYEEVQKRVILWIGEKISISPEIEQPLQGKKKSRVIVLLGPPGVGKTTTVVKLAALYGERNKGIWKKQVRLVTLDRYRIGAEYQLEKYGEVMNIPVSVVEDFDGLKKVLALYRQSADFILIDSIGKSPRNYVDLGKMKAVLDACPAKTEFHLCIQASTKGGDIREILKQFEPFKYKSVIVTKLDETNRAGNVISVLAEEQKPVSFITTGQTVPSDIEQATVIRFLINLEGFPIDRNALVDHFRGV